MIALFFVIQECKMVRYYSHISSICIFMYGILGSLILENSKQISVDSMIAVVVIHSSRILCGILFSGRNNNNTYFLMA